MAGPRITSSVARLSALALCLAPLPGADQGGPSGLAWRDPSPHQVRRVTVDGSVRLEVLDWGGSGPPLVLLGCYLSAHAYDDIAPKLTDQFHVVGITRRGIGGSDQPADGYSVQRSSDDLLGALDRLGLAKVVLLGTSCAGQVQTLFASQHAERVSGLVYLDGASDPTTTASAYEPPMPDLATLPRQAAPLDDLDTSSFAAYRQAMHRGRGFAFPEAELRQLYVVNPDGSMGESRLPAAIRRAITVDARITPDYAGIRAPVLALYQAQRPFADEAAKYVIRTDQERAALRQLYDATRALYTLWQRQLRDGVPLARIVELPGANVFMFLTHEADVLREVRAFARSLPPQ
ncbi:MAG: alpha/beta fold hydrolase [Vicinamibacterales bacterium]